MLEDTRDALIKPPKVAPLKAPPPKVKGTFPTGNGGNAAGVDTSAPKPPCPFYLKVSCKFGDKCTESHQGDMKNLIKRAAKAYGVPVAPVIQAGEEDKGDKKGKKGKGKGKGKKKGDNGSDSSDSESDGEGGRRFRIPLVQRPCLNLAFFDKCDNHEKKLCPYAHDQKTQADYKAGNIEGYSIDKVKKVVEIIKARGDTQFHLPRALSKTMTKLGIAVGGITPSESEPGGCCAGGITACGSTY